MYLHKDNKELFRDIVQLTSERLHVAEDIVEKDYYESISTNPLGNLPPYIKLETALMSYAFPTVEREINNYINIALSEEESELLEAYELQPFTMRVQALERTSKENG